MIVPVVDVVAICGNLFAASSIGKDSDATITVAAKALAAERTPVWWKRLLAVGTLPSHRRRSPLRVAATKDESPTTKSGTAAATTKRSSGEKKKQRRRTKALHVAVTVEVTVDVNVYVLS